MLIYSKKRQLEWNGLNAFVCDANSLCDCVCVCDEFRGHINGRLFPCYLKNSPFDWIVYTVQCNKQQKIVYIQIKICWTDGGVYGDADATATVRTTLISNALQFDWKCDFK